LESVSYSLKGARLNSHEKSVFKGHDGALLCQVDWSDQIEHFNLGWDWLGEVVHF